jgi:MFS family permease
MQLFSVLFCVFFSVSAILADRIGRRKMLIYATIAILFWFCIFFPKFRKFFLVTFFLCLGMTLMGLPMAIRNFLSELFPTNVRYSWDFVAFNGRNHQTAFAPMIAIWLATHYSLTYVGFYLSAAACIFIFFIDD